jgi:hypothetical protein
MAYSLSSIAKAARSKKRAGGSALPPLGSYDPSIFLQMQQNRRSSDDAGDTFALGQSQAQDDFGIQLGRLHQNHDLAVGDLGTSRDRSLSDLATSRDRSVGDLGTAAARAGEDHSNSLAALARRYAILGNQQGQADRQAHVESPGLLRQQAAIRSRNQGVDQAPIDLAYSRFSQDNAQAGQRLGEDFTRSSGRVGEDYTRGTSRADLDEQQREADLSLNLSRAYGSGKNGQPLGSATLNLIQSRNAALGGNLDLATVAHTQAAANGYVTPPRKKRRALIV